MKTLPGDRTIVTNLVGPQESNPAFARHRQPAADILHALPRSDMADLKTHAKVSIGVQRPTPGQQRARRRRLMFRSLRFRRICRPKRDVTLVSPFHPRVGPPVLPPNRPATVVQPFCNPVAAAHPVFGQVGWQGQAFGGSSGTANEHRFLRACSLASRPNAELTSPTSPLPVQYAAMFVAAGQPGDVKKVQASVATARKVFRIMRVCG